MGLKALGILYDPLKATRWSFKPAKAGEKFRKMGSPVSLTDKVDEFLREPRHLLNEAGA